MKKKFSLMWDQTMFNQCTLIRKLINEVIGIYIDFYIQTCGKLLQSAYVSWRDVSRNTSQLDRMESAQNWHNTNFIKRIETWKRAIQLWIG